MSELAACPVCGDKHKAGRAMSAHRREHTNVRVDCEHCNFKPLAYNLDKHVRTKHGHDDHLELDLRSLEDKDRLIREQAKQLRQQAEEIRRLTAALEHETSEKLRWRRLNMEKAAKRSK